MAHQRLEKRAWVIIDFKREIIFDMVGIPPIKEIDMAGRIPKKPGLYLVCPRPDQDDLLETFLWKIWERENTGVFVDEATFLPQRAAFKAIMQTGRSKRIPVIACSQRPVDVPRQLFSEANFFCIYRMADQRDYKTVQGFVPADLSRPLPDHHWRWYDVARNNLLHMRPVPPPRTVAGELAMAMPAQTSWHPFAWSSRPTARDKMRLH